jgi:hypothetical protein
MDNESMNNMSTIEPDDVFEKYDAVQLMIEKLKSVNVPTFSDGSYRVKTIDKDGSPIEIQVKPTESED